MHHQGDFSFNDGQAILSPHCWTVPRNTTMTKLLKLKNASRRQLATIANHGFFASAALLFVAQQAVLQSAPEPADAPMITQTLNLQPRTPPPGQDPEQLSGNELESAPSGELHFDAAGVAPGLMQLGVSGAELPASGPSGPVLTREDAPDRAARALPARERPE